MQNRIARWTFSCLTLLLLLTASCAPAAPQEEEAAPAEEEEVATEEEESVPEEAETPAEEEEAATPGQIEASDGQVTIIRPVRLSTGTFLVKKLSGGLGELTIENGLDLETVAVLASIEKPKDPLMAVYIQSKDSYTIGGITDGTYVLCFALGEDWDSDTKKFIGRTTYERFEDEFDFRTTVTMYTTWEVTLHPVVGGTAETEPVSEDEFPGSW